MSQMVSVIVPIYKVEKYLNKCIDSILNQTYKNIEVILVNDGSPDQCGKIAEDYAAIDNRIKVIHKENGGLSDARNLGMEYVTGEYTVFVDSDDWLDIKLIEKFLNTCKKYKADVVQSAFYYAYEDYLLFDNRYFSKKDPPIVLDNKTLMAELVVNERVKNFAWGKFYKTDIIRDIPFKKGVLFEDVFWAHKVMQRVNTYVLLNEPMCYYFQRNDSIVSTYTLKNLDIIKGLKERHYFIEAFYNNLSNESYKVLLKTIMIHYNLLILNSKKDKKGVYKKELQTFVKHNYSKFKSAVKDDENLKKQLMLFNIHPNLNASYLLLLKILRTIRVIAKPVGLERIDL